MKARLTLMIVLVAWLCGLQVSASPAGSDRLETDHFWFDNPDGSIENFPQYVDPSLRGWAMSISSSRYKPQLKNEPTGPYADLINWMFGRQARITVLALDTQGMSEAQLGQAAVAATTLVTRSTATTMGYLGALWQAMDEMVANKLGSAPRSDYHDGMEPGKPQPVTFMGKEAFRITSKMDMSRSPTMCAFGMPMLFVFDQYVYHDEAAQKMVGVIFQNTTLTETVDMTDDARLTTLFVNEVSKMLGYAGQDPSKTRMEEAYPNVDMKEYFAQHFHLKATPAGTPPCATRVEGKGSTAKIIVCGETLPPNILIGCPGPPEKTEDEGGGGTGGGGGGGTGGGGTGGGGGGTGGGGGGTGGGGGGGTGGSTESQEQTSVKQSGNKFAIIQLPENVAHTMCEDASNIYLLEAVSSWGASSNAVIAINKATGAISDIIAPQTVAERANIHHIGSDGKHLYVASEELGIRRYDGKSLASSTQIVNGHCHDNGERGKIIFSPNGRYMAYAGNCCYVFDLQDGNRRVKRYLGDSFVDATLTDAGDLYKVWDWELALARNNGIENDEGIESRSVGILLGGGPRCLQVIGDEVYLVGQSKVVKTGCGQFEWSEVGGFADPLTPEQAYLTRQGRGFAAVSGDMSHRFATVSVAGGSLTVGALGALNTGIKSSRHEENASTAELVYIDNNGNTWLQTNDFTLVVYNADGIRGLSGIAGKHVNYKR